MSFQNPLLDFAIGMIAFFLVASLIATALQEVIAQLTDMRAKTLRAAIGRMLDGDKMDGSGTEAFFSNPLIASLNTRKPEIGPSYIPRDIFTEVMRQATVAGAAASEFHKAAAALPVEGTPAQKVLKGLASNAAIGVQEFEKVVGDWFDAAMKRVSGFYKRKAQMLAFGLGLIIAASANLNAVAVGEFLASHGAARSAIAGAVTDRMQDGDIATPEAREKLRSALKDIMVQQAVPMGWSRPTTEALPKDPLWHEVFSHAVALIGHYAKQILHEGFAKGALAGWLVTALATTLGSAFWFDLLNRFVNIRATGPKPRKVKPPEA